MTLLVAVHGQLASHEFLSWNIQQKTWEITAENTPCGWRAKIALTWPVKQKSWERKINYIKCKSKGVNALKNALALHYWQPTKGCVNKNLSKYCLTIKTYFHSTDQFYFVTKSCLAFTVNVFSVEYTNNCLNSKQTLHWLFLYAFIRNWLQSFYLQNKHPFIIN